MPEMYSYIVLGIDLPVAHLLVIEIFDRKFCSKPMTVASKRVKFTLRIFLRKICVEDNLKKRKNMLNNDNLVKMCTFVLGFRL